jgi:hypothetical protein
LTKEYGVPATGSLLAMDMSRVAQAWVEKAEASRALEDARRTVDTGEKTRLRDLTASKIADYKASRLSAGSVRRKGADGKAAPLGAA